MIIRNEVNVSAKYFPNAIFPDGADYFPSVEGGISFRQATFQSITCMRIIVKIFRTFALIFTTFRLGRGKGFSLCSA